jgi:AcrR family transcriptional regulator
VSKDLKKRVKGSSEEPSRERLLSAATRLFGEKGYGSVSVREICKSGGTTINMIHHYFGSKEGLLEAIIERFNDGVFAVPTRLLKKSASSREDLISRLELLFETTLEAYIEHRAVMRVALREQRPLPAAVSFMLRFSEFIDEAKDKGYVRGDLDSALVSGAVLDRVLNQVQFAPWIKASSGKDVIDDADYRDAWCKANIDLFLRGFWRESCASCVSASESSVGKTPRAR